MSKEDPKATECYSIPKDDLHPSAHVNYIKWTSRADAAVLLWREDYDALIIMRDNFLEAVEAATPYFQSGGRFAHLLRPGDSILKDGIPALVKEFDAMRKELEELRDFASECRSRFDCDF